MKNYTYLQGLKVILPKIVRDQNVLTDWVMAAHTRSEELRGGSCDARRIKRFALKESQISQRYLECPDDDTDWEQHSIYTLSTETPFGEDIYERNQFFSKRAVEVFVELYSDIMVPDHLIHVTCTGYVAPSAPQLYFGNKKSSPQITHAYHMGCYASLPSVRMASSLAKDGNQKIDIVHNEMCSLHLRPDLHIPEQIVVQTLFADGHIRYQVSTNEGGLRILGIKEKIIPDTADDMSWVPSAHCMNMTLSRHVPLKIRDHILPFVMEMVEEFGLDLSDVIKRGVFAIHPGGPRIIEVVQEKLELKEEQVTESKKILFTRGNMSSATLPHVWNEIEKNNYPSTTPVVSLAFGPGLTVFGAVFEVV